jgi:hypothetical protein
MIGIVKGKKDNSKRKFPGERGPSPQFAKIKREEAAKRKEKYDSLSIEAKIIDLNEKLDKLRILGKEPGSAKKQIARLMKALEQKNAPTPPKKEEVVQTDDKKHVKAKERRKQEQ